MSRAVVVADVGKTRCRVAAVTTGDRRVRVSEGIGGLGADGAVPLLTDRIAGEALALSVTPEGAGIGVAGAWAHPGSAARLAREVADRLACAVVVASDVVMAHAGALRGDPGVLLIAGTGAAALMLDESEAHLVDGWGPELGDFGSGAWIGREAARAALRAEAGLGPGTALLDRLTADDTLAGIVRRVSEASNPAGLLWSLAPAALEEAERGDAVSEAIVDEAVRLLTASAVTAAGRSRGSESVHVATVGGLTGHAWFAERLAGNLRQAGLVVDHPAGDALDGAALLLRRSDLPHERSVHRAG